MTMDCAAATQQMLEAELAELRAEADTEFARHLASCAECRARAARIIERESALDRALAALALGSEGRQTRKRPMTRVKSWLPPVALAAAAALALLWLAPGLEESAPDSDTLYAALNPEPPVVEAGAQRTVIMRDEARSITIVWLTQTSPETRP